MELASLRLQFAITRNSFAELLAWFGIRIPFGACFATKLNLSHYAIGKVSGCELDA